MSVKGSDEMYVELRGALSHADGFAELQGAISQGDSPLELQGSISPSDSFIELRGFLSRPDLIHGKSAYEVAVANGFKGSEEEWLASLKGDAASDEQVEEVVNRVLATMHMAKIGYVTILANKWVGEDSPYSQVVAVDGATENSQVDLTPSVEQLAIFHEKDLAFVTENYGGVVTVYAVGQKPENDYTIQVTITEVGV